MFEHLPTRQVLIVLAQKAGSLACHFEVYIILNIMCLGQKMSLPSGQIADKNLLAQIDIQLALGNKATINVAHSALEPKFVSHWLPSGSTVVTFLICCRALTKMTK